jgi:hypothetical protein
VPQAELQERVGKRRIRGLDDAPHFHGITLAEY